MKVGNKLYCKKSFMFNDMDLLTKGKCYVIIGFFENKWNKHLVITNDFGTPEEFSMYDMDSVSLNPTRTAYYNNWFYTEKGKDMNKKRVFSINFLYIMR